MESVRVRVSPQKTLVGRSRCTWSNCAHHSCSSDGIKGRRLLLQLFPHNYVKIYYPGSLAWDVDISLVRRVFLVKSVPTSAHTQLKSGYVNIADFDRYVAAGIYFYPTFKKSGKALFFSGASNGLHCPQRGVAVIGLAPALQLAGIWKIRPLR